MKASIYLASVFYFGVALNTLFAQNNSSELMSTDTQYDVHREYDENGNLIAYDSIVITSSGNNSENIDDSLPEYWTYTPLVTDSIEQNCIPYHYGFDFPGEILKGLPQINMDIEFHNIDSLLKGFNYSFVLTQGDSSNLRNPYLDLYGQFPPLEPNIDMTFQKMQMMIDEIIDKHQNFFKKPQEDLPSGPKDENGEIDFLVPKPETEPQGYTGHVIKM
jgi:hypothetical protein